MKCPYCGEEMQKGYIQSARENICWSEKKRPAAMFPFGSGEVISLTGERGPLDGFTAIAFCCKKCKKVVIDYEV